jgi:hypothetical protein
VLIATVTDELRFGFAEAVRERRRQRKRDSVSSSVRLYKCNTVDNNGVPCAQVTHHEQFDQNVSFEETTEPPYQQRAEMTTPTRAHEIVDRLHESDYMW